MPDEEAVFYGTLRDVAGQKPEMCLKEATRRLGGSKDYPQVQRAEGGGVGVGWVDARGGRVWASVSAGLHGRLCQAERGVCPPAETQLHRCA